MVAVAMTLPAASLTAIVSPAEPVPDNVGVVSLVRESPVTPESLDASRRAAGEAGAVVSRVIAKAVAGPALPAGSVAVIDRVFSPSGKAATGVAVQLPSGCTIAEAITLPEASLMVIVSPALPVPESVGVASFVFESPVTPVSLDGSRTADGATGAVVSIVIGKVVAVLALPT